MFTDEELKRLKEAKHEGFYEYFKMDSLLERLEAAEVYVEAMNGLEPHKWHKDMFKAWRRAAGKR